MIEDLSWFGIQWDQGPSSEEIFEVKKKIDEKNNKKEKNDNIRKKIGKKSGDSSCSNLSVEIETDIVRFKQEDCVKVLISPAVSGSGITNLENSDFHRTTENINENKPKKIKYENSNIIALGLNPEEDTSISENNFELEIKRIFHGVNVEPFLTVFCQSRRSLLYNAAWQRLVDLKFGAFTLLFLF
jgi:hypothetical protein